MRPSNPGGKAISDTTNCHGPKSASPRASRFDVTESSAREGRACSAAFLLRTDVGVPVSHHTTNFPRSVSTSVAGSPCHAGENGTAVPLQPADVVLPAGTNVILRCG